MQPVHAAAPFAQPGEPIPCASMRSGWPASEAVQSVPDSPLGREGSLAPGLPFLLGKEDRAMARSQRKRQGQTKAAPRPDFGQAKCPDCDAIMKPVTLGPEKDQPGKVLGCPK